MPEEAVLPLLTELLRGLPTLTDLFAEELAELRGEGAATSPRSTLENRARAKALEVAADEIDLYRGKHGRAQVLVRPATALGLLQLQRWEVEELDRTIARRIQLTRSIGGGRPTRAKYRSAFKAKLEVALDDYARKHASIVQDDFASEVGKRPTAFAAALKDAGLTWKEVRARFDAKRREIPPD